MQRGRSSADRPSPGVVGAADKTTPGLEKDDAMGNILRRKNVRRYHHRRLCDVHRVFWHGNLIFRPMRIRHWRGRGRRADGQLQALIRPIAPWFGALGMFVDNPAHGRRGIRDGIADADAESRERDLPSDLCPVSFCFVINKVGKYLMPALNPDRKTCVFRDLVSSARRGQITCKSLS